MLSLVENINGSCFLLMSPGIFRLCGILRRGGLSIGYRKNVDVGTVGLLGIFLWFNLYSLVIMKLKHLQGRKKCKKHLWQIVGGPFYVRDKDNDVVVSAFFRCSKCGRCKRKSIKISCFSKEQIKKLQKFQSRMN